MCYGELTVGLVQYSHSEFSLNARPWHESPTEYNAPNVLFENTAPSGSRSRGPTFSIMQTSSAIHGHAQRGGGQGMSYPLVRVFFCLFFFFWLRSLKRDWDDMLIGSSFLLLFLLSRFVIVPSCASLLSFLRFRLRSAITTTWWCWQGRSARSLPGGETMTTTILWVW
ncbi:hypothetical protein C8F01DRAFT_1169308 [Mycena amicta]|nr:hypothetical protein C8F01DRAFT_1169308 [Mycena amicta]